MMFVITDMTKIWNYSIVGNQAKQNTNGQKILDNIYFSRIIILLSHLLHFSVFTFWLCVDTPNKEAFLIQ